MNSCKLPLAALAAALSVACSDIVEPVYVQSYEIGRVSATAVLEALPAEKGDEADPADLDRLKAEIEADVLLKGTRVDGVYTADPEKDPSAVKFPEITFEEVLDRRLKVMDLTAFTLCRENRLEIIVFDMDTEGNLGKVLAGEPIGTLVKL